MEQKMATKTASVEVAIKPPKIETAHFHIVGTSPYVQCRFSHKAMNMMAEKMLAAVSGAAPHRTSAACGGC